MLRGVCRVLVLLLLGLVVAPASFAGGPASANKEAGKAKKVATASAKSVKSAKSAEKGTAQTQKRMSPEQLRAMREGVGKNVGEWVPMPATNGTPGFFTLNTGDTLPKGAFAVTGYVHKYGRAPGSLNILNVGWTWGIGITNRLTAFVGWDTYRHIHVGSLNELSMAYPDKPLYPGTILTVPFPALGNRPAYPEDFPFAYENNGGIGPVTVGAKFNILSELRGDPVSFAIRDEAYIPTKTGLSDLLAEGAVQTGAFSDLVGATVSKTFAGIVTWSFDYGHLFTRDPRGSVSAPLVGLTYAARQGTGLLGGNVNPALTYSQYDPSGSSHLVTLADQERFGTGFLFFPKSRFQLMTEYDGVVYDGNATPTITFGPRDPLEGMWGFRVYPWHIVSLDLGYTYMMNVPELKDRSGFIFKLNTEYWPGKPIPADIVTVSSTADPHSVQQASGQLVTLTAHGTDSLGHSLTYTWTAPAGSIRGTGPDVQWDAGSTDPGKYTLTVRAEDPYGNFANSSQQITVTPKPIPPPTMVCSAARPSILPGERIGITATVHDESGTALTYTWRTTGGSIVGSGASVTFDSTGLAPGTYTVTGRVENAKGQAADCTAQVTVQAPPPPKPEASKIDQCSFRTYSTRVDNVCKRILDNVALRLQNETGAHVVVIGYASAGKSARSQRLAQRRAAARAENAKKYLVSKGVSADRVETRTGAATAGASVKENNRIEIIWVPEGATY